MIWVLNCYLGSHLGLSQQTELGYVYIHSNRYMFVGTCLCVHIYLTHNFTVCTYRDTWVHFSRISIVIFRPFLHVFCLVAKVMPNSMQPHRTILLSCEPFKYA